MTELNVMGLILIGATLLMVWALYWLDKMFERDLPSSFCVFMIFGVPCLVAGIILLLV